MTMTDPELPLHATAPTRNFPVAVVLEQQQNSPDATTASEVRELQRQLDEIPSRTELSQYQKRFLELYSLVASKLSETRQFYNLYNILDATKLYLTREVTLLNSIFDNFEKAKATRSNQEKFLDTLESMLKSVRELLGKVETKRNDEKTNRDAASEKYVQLIDKQRQYYKAVLEFQEVRGLVRSTRGRARARQDAAFRC